MHNVFDRSRDPHLTPDSDKTFFLSLYRPFSHPSPQHIQLVYNHEARLWHWHCHYRQRYVFHSTKRFATANTYTGNFAREEHLVRKSPQNIRHFWITISKEGHSNTHLSASYPKLPWLGLPTQSCLFPLPPISPEPRRGNPRDSQQSNPRLWASFRCRHLLRRVWARKRVCEFACSWGYHGCDYCVCLPLLTNALIKC